jgi:hypothetical protein
MKFESRNEKLAPMPVFVRRLVLSTAFSAAIMLGTLSIGIAGYHWIAGFAWIDSLLNASMILGGMGPIGDLPSDSAKVFASVYALFCGLVLLSAISIALSPILHRMLHRFHLDEKDIDPQE